MIPDCIDPVRLAVSPAANPTVLWGSYQPAGQSCFPGVTFSVLKFFRLVILAIPPLHSHAYHHGVYGLVANKYVTQRPAVVIFTTTLMVAVFLKVTADSACLALFPKG